MNQALTAQGQRKTFWRFAREKLNGVIGQLILGAIAIFGASDNIANLLQ